MKSAEWYFDFVSPFAYFQSTRLRELGRHVALDPRPVLFGALLNHWETVGPAEIGPKRLWTYEHCLWIAKRHGIAWQMPDAHPFNPLPLLRLALVFAADGVVPVATLERLFAFVWRDGHLPGTPAWEDLLIEMGVAAEQLEAAAIKSQLRSNGERALASGVFGVPTTVCEGRRFWGFDATDMLLAFLEGDPLFDSEAFRSLGTVPVGIERRKTLPPQSGAAPSVPLSAPLSTPLSTPLSGPVAGQGGTGQKPSESDDARR